MRIRSDACDSETAARSAPVSNDAPLSGSGYLLTRIGAESRRRWARMLAEHDLTPHHYGVLIALRQLRTSHQQRLADAIGVDPRNAVPVIDLLERRGLIARTTDTTDRRRRVIELTDAGLDVTEELERAADMVEAEMLGALTPRQQTTLNQLLHKLYEGAVAR
jgi:DNA-binding MarR family transcriptional regulator